MAEHIFALLIHDGAEHFAALRKMLSGLSVETCTVSTCQEAARLISRRRPDVIFTECSMKGGAWADALNLACKDGILLNVIVVAAHADMHLYLSVMEGGAFDFAVPPFEHESLEFMVKSAAHRACRRPRQLLSHAAVN
jgi:DNA-binding NtrC family response regulator